MKWQILWWSSDNNVVVGQLYLMAASWFVTFSSDNWDASDYQLSLERQPCSLCKWKSLKHRYFPLTNVSSFDPFSLLTHRKLVPPLFPHFPHTMPPSQLYWTRVIFSIYFIIYLILPIELQLCCSIERSMDGRTRAAVPLALANQLSLWDCEL